MNKFIKYTAQLVLAVSFMLTFGDRVYSANMFVRLNQPKSPTNQNEFPLSFEALDFLNRPMTVKCYKKGPSDSDYVQFGDTQNLPEGGNSGTCSVQNLSSGTYEFKVTATAGVDSQSATTSVSVDTSGPGDARDYSKTKTNSCEYTIHFKTADDGGATTKVEVYRSENTSFTADSGTRIESVAMGSNEEKNVTNTPSGCSKTYYYAVRAFDSAGNGSALVGDSEIHTTVVNQTTTTRAGAITVNAGGSILGKSTLSLSVTPTGSASGEVQGDSDTVTPAPVITPLSTGKKIGLTIGLLLTGLLAYYLWSRRNNVA